MKGHIVLAAGGTGGHMFPAQSVAESFAQKGWSATLTTDDRGMRYADNFAPDVARIVLPTASFSQGSLWKRATAPFKILQGVLKSWTLFRRIKPSAVIGFGGYPAVPALVVARIMGIPYFIHEQNAVLGRTNRLFQTKASKVACGLWPVVGAGSNAVYVGNPVRSRILDLAATPLPKEKTIQILIFGGSQGASVFTRIIPQALELLPDDFRRNVKLVQQVREAELEGLRETYAALNIDADLAPFFSDLPERMARSHFVVARSGASTLAELQMIGRGSILVPLPSAMNDHQRLNAKSMVAAGAAIEFDEQENTAEDLANWLKSTITSPQKLEQMANAAAAMARPNSAGEIVELIVKDLKHD